MNEIAWKRLCRARNAEAPEERLFEKNKKRPNLRRAGLIVEMNGIDEENEVGANAENGTHSTRGFIFWPQMGERDQW